MNAVGLVKSNTSDIGQLLASYEWHPSNVSIRFPFIDATITNHT